MALENLIPLLAASDSHRQLSANVERLSSGQMIEIEGLAAAARYPLLASLLARREHSTVILAGRQDSAEEIAASLSAYLPDDRAPAVWPVPEPLPYEQLPLDREAGARRVELLRRLQLGDPIIVVVPARGLTQLLSSPDWLVGHSWKLQVGDRLSSDFVRVLLECGYEHVPVVDGSGQVARRGGIIDVFPPGGRDAVRIELFGDAIESLRAFDPDSQRTIRHVTEVEIAPPFVLDLSHAPEAAKRLRKLDVGSLRPEVEQEWQRQLERLDTGSLEAGIDLFSRAIEPHPAQILDYLAPEGLVIVVDPASVRLSIDQLQAQAEELRHNLEGAGELPVGIERPYHRWMDIEPALRRTRQLALGAVPSTWVKGVQPEPVVPPRYTTELPIFPGRFDDLLPIIDDYLKQEWVVAMASDQSARLTDLLEQHDIFPRVQKRGAPAGTTPPPAGSVELAHARLNGGWRLDEPKLILLTDQELFGYHRTAPAPPRPRARQFTGALPKLVPGSYVVHIEHGIARYAGMVKLDMTGVERDYLRLDYAENDRLYLPVDRIDRITPYEGPGLEPKLTRLGSQEWARVKQRVRQAVREMAFELLQLYASREASEGHAFSPDIAWDVELAESFAFVETPDQARAILDVKGDMETVRPMDRLVCGDVGYGKTEVALRAAFKAVNDGFQVAVLVPTTILALQHFHTFRSRLAAFPIKVEMLSRLRSKREQQDVVKGLSFGAIDIVIGTHRLLQSDIQFKQLGLLVIDEEQRFGVAHKEQVKRARSTVDVLTMTATPIPRTLHMALSGIRDLSIINTPPRDRTPIRTFVTPFSDNLVREAILREIGRGGQVYYVHNRVRGIHQVVRKLNEIVPEARVAVGHGQMDEGELEQVMLAFIEHEYDVLVCTTIIESGVDIPNVNTIIVDRANTFGLTQLYQLRGRVGRSHNRAYAYLLYDQHQPLSQEAVARLEAIQEATELGAGFQIALRDLEIRGAGNVLGSEQSGHIAAVGFDLYTRMLANAVEEIKQGKPIEEPEAVTIDLPVDASIPEEYVFDEGVRIGLYRRIAAAATFAEVRDIGDEMVDRFGPTPEQVERLLELAELRVRASNLGITTAVARAGDIYIRPVVGSRMSQRELRRRLGEGVYVTPNQVRLVADSLDSDVWDAVVGVFDAVAEANATVLAVAD